jgi:hypothetical protein
MTHAKGRLTLVALAALTAVFALALASHGGQAAPAAHGVAGVPATPVLAAAGTSPVGGATTAAAAAGDWEPAAVTPHCCSQGEIDACRSGCRDQGPGCKGQISCHAGECVCTCNCP